MLTSLEICAGAGGQALGLAMAGFVHVALVNMKRTIVPPEAKPSGMERDL